MSSRAASSVVFVQEMYFAPSVTVDESGFWRHLRQDLRRNERPVLGIKYVLGSLIMVPQLNLDPYISCGAIARLPKTCLLPKTSGSFCLKFVSKLGLYTK